MIEQPYKTPYLASLFTLLSSGSAVVPDDLTPDPVQTVFDDLCKSFQTTLDRLAWRDIRLYVSI